METVTRDGKYGLVLSRERGQRIVIGEDIVITVTDIRGDKVRLGIKAPPEIPVHREEVAAAIAREHRAAARVAPEAIRPRRIPPAR